VRINQAERFLKDGDKVKATVMFRVGDSTQRLSRDLLKRMATDLQELGEVQQAPKRKEKMMMLMYPKECDLGC